MNRTNIYAFQLIISDLILFHFNYHFTLNIFCISANEDLFALTLQLKKKIVQLGGLLSKRLCQRDSLKRRSKRICNILTEILMKIHKDGKYFPA